jgi:histidinol dehydrogenase
MAQRLNARDPSFAEAYARLLADRTVAVDGAEEAAGRILRDVRARGLDAVLDWTARLDGLTLAPDSLRASAEEIAAARAACDPAVVRALEMAAERILDFHQRQKPQDARFTDAAGASLGWRWTPVDAAGLYAPGGKAAYPSSVLMNALPARAAGVERLVMVTPPGRVRDNPAILAAASVAGVTEIWKIGGAQAIGALAYGAGPIARVDVIVGPGNAYVAAAKKLVFGDVGIDSIAGPSEVFIIADGRNDPDWIAIDLLAQAEHDEDAQSILFTDDAVFADAVAAALDRMIAQGRAGAPARASWAAHGAIVVVERLEDALALSDAGAPEHLQIAAEEAETLAARVRHAGAIFIGRHTPEALGDYVAGPNHVLPTGQRARFSSGLGTLHFMKRTTLLGVGPEALARIGPAAAALAHAEGLPAHAGSVELRLKGSP